jgi:threonine dehydrogenase-like Zn-dependent dehydrogenase
MRACVATGEKGRIECRDVPTPSVEPGTLLLKTRCALICGSDLEYLDGVHGEIVPEEIRGHEFVAEVVEVGEGVRGWEVGDRAAPISYASNYGCWADYFVCPPVGIQKVPEHIPDEEAVFVEPLHTGFGSVEAAELKPGRSVAVIGVGKLGLLTVMSATVAGAAPVIAIDIDQSRLEKALEVGAHDAFNGNDSDVISKVQNARMGLMLSSPALEGATFSTRRSVWSGTAARSCWPAGCRRENSTPAFCSTNSSRCPA